MCIRDRNYTEATVNDTDKDGNVDQIRFTIDYTEDYLVTTVHYTTSVETGFESALCFDFSKAEAEGGDQPPVEEETEATHTIKLEANSTKAEEVIQIPDEDEGIMTSAGGIDNAIKMCIRDSPTPCLRVTARRQAIARRNAEKRTRQAM